MREVTVTELNQFISYANTSGIDLALILLAKFKIEHRDSVEADDEVDTDEATGHSDDLMHDLFDLQREQRLEIETLNTLKTAADARALAFKEVIEILVAGKSDEY